LYCFTSNTSVDGVGLSKRILNVILPAASAHTTLTTTSPESGVRLAFNMHMSPY
jgi:hypothetical protein